MSVKTVNIESINYGYIPTLIEHPKVLWVQLVFPAPEGIQINEKVAILDCNDNVLGLFRVDDVVGTRIILKPTVSQIGRRVNECDIKLYNRNPRNFAREERLERGVSQRLDYHIRDWVYGSGKTAAKLAFICL